MQDSRNRETAMVHSVILKREQQAKELQKLKYELF